MKHRKNYRAYFPPKELRFAAKRSMSVDHRLKNIAIFASGEGSNALKIITHLTDNASVRVRLIVSNKNEAGVIAIAAAHSIETFVIDRPYFYGSAQILDVLEQHSIDFIVLAGFLWLIPPYLIERYERKIINIHPALLPAFGGKGMYGMHVHEAVKSSGVNQTGITIHYVNHHYDEGDIIFQASVAVDKTDSPVEIARKVLQLEHRHFPVIVHQLVSAL